MSMQRYTFMQLEAIKWKIFCKGMQFKEINVLGKEAIKGLFLWTIESFQNGVYSQRIEFDHEGANTFKTWPLLGRESEV